VGSDGLFDNLYPDDIVECLYPYMKGAYLANPTLAADCMSSKAVEKGYDRAYLSPFAKGAHEAGKRYMGGKPDDTTTIVAQIEFSSKIA